MLLAYKHENENRRKVNETEPEKASRRVAVTVSVEPPCQVDQIGVERQRIGSKRPSGQIEVGSRQADGRQRNAVS